MSWILASLLTVTSIGCGDDNASGGAGGEGAGGAGAGPGTGGSGGADADTYAAVHDTFCAPEELIGQVTILYFPSVSVELFDEPNPHLGPPEITTPTCAFHAFDPGDCGACDPGTTCSFASGECVAERRTIKDAKLVVTADGESETFTADPTLGGVSGDLTVGGEGSAFEMELTWGDRKVTLAPMVHQTAELEDHAMTTEGIDPPGAVDVTWAPGESGHVVAQININHHAAGPTFTYCVAPASSGAFHADAEMIDPLSIVTGLEYGGIVDYMHVAAAQLPEGCVEFRFGARQIPY